MNDWRLQTWVCPRAGAGLGMRDWGYHETWDPGPEPRLETVMRSVSCRPLTHSRVTTVQVMWTIQCHLSCGLPTENLSWELIDEISVPQQQCICGVFVKMLCEHNIICRIIWSVVAENVGLCFHSAIDLNNMVMMRGGDTEHNNNFAQCRVGGVLIISMHTLMHCLYQDKAL